MLQKRDKMVMKITITVIFIASVLSSYSCRSNVREGPLDPQIPKADPTKYANIRTADQWQNPFIVIHSHGVSLTCLANSQKGDEIFSTDDLVRRLIELPVTAWPYGKIVAIQENSTRSGNDGELIEKNRVRVEEILKVVGVIVDRWPSA